MRYSRMKWRANRMRENGWRAAREEFRWDVERRRLLRLYERVAPSIAALYHDHW